MKRRFLIVFLLALLLMLNGCSSSTPLSGSGVYLDTVITITLYGTSDESLLDECFSLCRRYENMLSRTVEGSDIYRINHAQGKTVEVSEETAGLLKKSASYSQLTDGAFDCTIAPLSTLWDFKQNTGMIPETAAIARACSLVDYRTVKLDGTAVTLSNPQASIDLGGIAKGYIADRLKDYLESKGVESALLNLGGNVLTIGSKPDGSDWNIGIQKPFDEENQSITSVTAADSSVVTSGVYERCFTLDGTLYHHILNPSDGYPVQNGLYSVTILSKTSVDGDALSTACFVLGKEKGMELIESLPDVEALFVTSEYELLYSSGI